MELKEWWDIDYKIIPIDTIKYDKKVEIIIKNHSPFERAFKIMFKGANLKDQMNSLTLRMYLDIIAPQIITVDKYSKEIFEVNIPRLPIKEKDAYMDIAIINEHTKEEKTIRVYF